MAESKSKIKITNYTSLNFIAFLLSCFSGVMFAVFISSTQTYYITDVLGIGAGIGNYIGTLSFADELLSMLLVPFVGAMADRIGTRPLLCLGFFVVGISLIGFGIFVHNSVFPAMYFWRLLFSSGLTCCMGVFVVMLLELNNSNFDIRGFFSFKSSGANSLQDFDQSDALRQTMAQASESLRLPEDDVVQNTQTNRDDDLDVNLEQQPLNGSLDDSEIVTNTAQGVNELNKKRNDGKRASLMGTFSGLGAVFAVFFLLRLPVWFGQNHPAGVALRRTYISVGISAIAISIILFFIAYKDDSKKLFKDDIDELFEELDVRGAEDDDDNSILENEDLLLSRIGTKKSYWESVKYGIELSIQNPMIILAYFGGFTSRCITIAITSFIPFYINHYFYNSGKCSTLDSDKVHCPESYILSSILTGIANTSALVLAPIAGILVDRISNHIHLLLIVNVFSFIGFFGLSFISEPDSSIMIFIFAIMVGGVQIFFIIISMTMLSNIVSLEHYYPYKGAISGVSSLVGGVGILFISLVGGLLGDIKSSSPFIIIAIVNIAFIYSMIRLRKVKENNNRNFESVIQKFKNTSVGKMVFRSRGGINSDEFEEDY